MQQENAGTGHRQSTHAFGFWAVPVQKTKNEKHAKQVELASRCVSLVIAWASHFTAQ
jgi:hypothetical protein